MEGTAESSLLQRQAQALGDPTRYRIFRYVAEAAEPTRVADLTAHLGLNHTGIRQHLAKLCAAGLLVEEQAPPIGPGRPPRRYRVAPSAAAQWDGRRAYEELALVLLDMQRTRTSVREAGAAVGRRLSSEPSGGTVLDLLEAEMARRGFEPLRRQRDSGADLVLGRCAVAEAASVDPDIVCEFHQGVAEGILDTGEGDFRLTELARQDPRRGGCVLRVQRGR